MIIKLNSNGSIDIVPQVVPESLDSVLISYVFPTGLNHLKPVLTWGGVRYEGQNIYISKVSTKFDMKVSLYNGNELYKEYRASTQPTLYIGYNIERIQPDIFKHMQELEQEVKDLKERGDII